MQTSILKISEIKINEKIYPREKLNKGIVHEYVRDMKKGDKFPPIYAALFNKKYYLVDGRHRLEAKEILGEKHIEAEVKTNFPDMSDIFLASVRANIRHGLRLTERDRLKIAYQLKDMKYDVADISKLIGISVRKLDTQIQYQLSQLVFKQKMKDKEYPEKLTFKERPNVQIESIVDEKEVIATMEENREELQIIYLKEIYNYLKGQKFSVKNQKIKKLLNKIRKVARI